MIDYIYMMDICHVVISYFQTDGDRLNVKASHLNGSVNTNFCLKTAEFMKI